MKPTTPQKVAQACKSILTAASAIFKAAARASVLAAIVVIVSSPTFAGPRGGVVVGGEASISSSPGVTTIDQASRRAIINWRDFNIDEGELTRFRQPGRDAIALNRVLGNDPSSILGQLKANGQVWLVNRNGVFIGRDAQIDVHSLLATTADIADQDFLADRFSFGIPSPNLNAGVINEGTISIGEHGLAGLVAPHVRNDGVISGRLGQVVIAGAPTFTVDFYGDGLIQFATTSKVTETQDASAPLVSNSGTISVEGGDVLITADAAAEIVEDVINMNGVVEAQSFAMEQGVVVLNGGDNGTVMVAGDIDASGNEPGEVGGTIKVLGEQLALVDQANIDVSGDSGGGQVLIGGNRQGQGEESNAKEAFVGYGTSVNADAMRNGDGGEIVIWSERFASVHGSLSARGGSEFGDGGFIETSARLSLALTSTPDASAPYGTAGVWFIDPTNITIVATGGGDLDSNVVDAGVISAALSGGTSVTLDTELVPDGPFEEEGFIDQAPGADITNTGDSEVTLRLNANSHIVLNAGITSTSSPLNVMLNADSDDSGAGSITLNSAASITSNGGDIIMGGGGDPGNKPAIGDSQVEGIFIDGAEINSGAGIISLRGSGASIEQSGGVGIDIRDNTLLASTTGDIELIGVGGEGSGDFNRGINIQGNVTIGSSQGGAITLDGTGGTGDADNLGIFMFAFADGEVTDELSLTTTTGDIKLIGVGGEGSGPFNRGINIDGNVRISSSQGGAITLDGTGGTGDADNNGISIFTDEEGDDLAELSLTTTTGDIELIGVGGEGGGGFISRGISIQGNVAFSSSEGGAITLDGTGGTDGGDNNGIFMGGGSIESFSEVGPGGAISLSAGSNITVGNLVFGSSDPNQPSGGLTVDTPAVVDLSGGLTPNGADTFIGRTDQRPANVLLPPTIDTNGGAFSLFVTEDFTFPSNLSTAGGGVTLDSLGSVILADSISVGEGNVVVSAGQTIEVQPIISFPDEEFQFPIASALIIESQGGNVSVEGAAIVSGIDTDTGFNGELAISTDGGNISVTSREGGIPAELALIADSSSESDPGGAISLSAGSNITVGNLVFGSSDPNQPSGGLTVDTPAVADLSGGLTPNGADTFIGRTDQRPANVLLPPTIDTDGGAFSLFVTEDFTFPSNLSTDGGGITLDSLGNVTLADSISTGEGDVLIRAGDTIVVLPVLFFDEEDGSSFSPVTIATLSGDVDLEGANIISGSLEDFNFNGQLTINTQGGGISVASLAGSIPAELALIADSSSESGSGGNINLRANENLFALGSTTAESGPAIDASGAFAGGQIDLSAAGAISTGDIRSFGEESGGRIAVTSTSGAVTTGDIDANSEAQGGQIDLAADGALTTGDIIATSGFGFGGQIDLTASGDISTGAIRSTSPFGGGAITLRSTNGGITTDFATEGPPFNPIDSSATDGPGGNVTLAAGEDIDIGSVDSSSSEVDPGGAISLSAGSNITAGNLVFGSSGPNQPSGGLTVDTPAVADLSGGLTPNGADTVIGRTDQRPANVLLPPTIDADGGAFSLFVTEDFTFPSNLSTAGGGVTLDSLGSVMLADSISAGEGNVVVSAGQTIEVQPIISFPDEEFPIASALVIESQGGNVSVKGAAIISGIDTDTGFNGELAISTEGGNISVASEGGIPAELALIADSSSASGSGGNINLRANENLFALGSTTAESGPAIDASGAIAGGSVDIASQVGAVEVGPIDASSTEGPGGAISLSAGSDISAKNLVFGSEVPNQGGGSLTVDTPAVVNLSGGLTPNGADTVIGQTDRPANIFLTANTNTEGGAFSLFVAGDYNFPSNLSTDGGLITLDSLGSITLANSVSAGEGDVMVDAAANLTMSDNVTGRFVDLEAGGAIAQSGSSINADTLLIQAGKGINVTTNDLRQLAARSIAGDIEIINTGSDDTTVTSLTELDGQIAADETETLERVEGLSAEGGAVQFQTGGRLILGSPVIGTSNPASGEQYSILLVTDEAFQNNAGSGALNPGSNRYLVYSIDPITDARNIPAADFDERFSFPFDRQDPDGSSQDLPSDVNFFLYEVQEADPNIPEVLPPEVLPNTNPEQKFATSTSEALREEVLGRQSEPLVTVPGFQPHFAVPKIQTLGDTSGLLFSNDGNHQLWGR